jgi:hypothetical protein
MRLDDFLHETRRQCDASVGLPDAQTADMRRIRKLLAMVDAVCGDPAERCYDTGQSARSLMQEALDGPDADGPGRPRGPSASDPFAAPWLPNAEQMYAMLASAHGGAANFPETIGVKAGLRSIEAIAPWLPSAEQMYALLASAHGGAANFPETCNVKAGLCNIEALIRQHVAAAQAAAEAGHAGLAILWRHANPPTDEDRDGSEDILVWNPKARREGEPCAGYVLRRRGTYETLLCEKVPAKLCALLAQEWGTTPYDGKRNEASLGFESFWAKAGSRP